MTSEEYDELTEEQIITTIAKMCGWQSESLGDGLPVAWKRGDRKTAVNWRYLPRYTEDLNACHYLESLLPQDKRELYCGYLEDASYDYNFGMVHATAKHRCKAFVLIMEGK